MIFLGFGGEYLRSRGAKTVMQSLWAVIHGGRIEPADLPEGVRVLVTLMPEDDSSFWTDASQKSLAAIWDNAEDGDYAQLLN
jgi:hypothetical protein